MLEAALSTSPLVTRLLVGPPVRSQKHVSRALPGPAEEAVLGCFASQFQTNGEMNPLQTT